MRMGRNCCIPGCKTGYKGSPSCHRLFYVPSTNIEKWRRAIPRKDRIITAKDSVCTAHFDERFIVKNDVFVVDGKEILHPRIRWKLTPDVVPHLFPNLPGYLTTNHYKRKAPKIRNNFNSETVSNANCDDYALDEISQIQRFPCREMKLTSPEIQTEHFKKKIKSLQTQLGRMKQQRNRALSDLNNLRKNQSFSIDKAIQIMPKKYKESYVVTKI